MLWQQASVFALYLSQSIYEAVGWQLGCQFFLQSNGHTERNQQLPITGSEVSQAPTS